MPKPINPQSLVKTIRSQFSVPEIRNLCFDLGIPHEEIAGDTVSEKARELVLYCQRRNRLPELAQRVTELRSQPLAEPGESELLIMPNQVNETEKTNRIAKIWVPIIVALIGLAGIIITNLGKDDVPTSNSSLTPPATNGFVYSVTVMDKVSTKPIENAHILIETGGGFAPKNAYTDSNGFVRITIDASQSGRQGRLSISATNYERQTHDIDLTSDALPQEIRLEPE